MENEKGLPPLVVDQQNTNYYSSSSSSSNTHKSIETLLVVLAIITILGVIASIIARLCGGRHFSGNGEDDIEGWVERKCRSCIDGGIPNTSQLSPPSPSPAKEEVKTTTTTTTTTQEEGKK
uniref:Transmembrane protein n=1 Tax=Solanum lycopersicum TaxID=4081 RepID=A0A3Q7FY97_SOLLC